MSISSSLSPQLDLSYSPLTVAFQNWNNQTVSNEIRVFKSLNFYDVPFTSWVNAYENVKSQIDGLTTHIEHFIDHPETVNTSSIQKALRPIQIDDPSVTHALKMFSKEMLRSNFSIVETMPLTCHQNIFLFVQNILSAIATPSLFQVGFLLEHDTKGTITNLSINNSTTSPSKIPGEQSNDTNLNEIKTPFDQWPTAFERVRKQIEDLSTTSQAFNATTPHDTWEELWNSIQRIRINGSDIANDLNTIEETLRSSKSIQNRDRGKLLRLVQNLHPLIKYLFLYPPACLSHAQAVNPAFNKMAASGEKLEDQNGFKTGGFLFWFSHGLTVLLSFAIFTLGCIFSKKAQRRAQTKDSLSLSETESETDGNPEPLIQETEA